MVKAIAITKFGGPEVLQFVEVEVPSPAPDEITIRHTAIELNFLDIHQRTGDSPINGEVKIPGISAVGVVEKVGTNIDYLSVGDRVCYATAESGAYSVKRNISAEKVVTIDSELSDSTIAACLVKGLTAHYLATRAFIIKTGMAVVIHSAAGGVGQILAKYAVSTGAYVIGTVSADEKRKAALDAGCHIVLNRKTEDWPKRVRTITQDYGATAVYDAIGKDTLDGSIECLAKIGILVHYGDTSGAVDMLDTRKLRDKSLFYTRPSLLHYKRNRKELLISVAEVLAAVEGGSISVNIHAELPLEKAAEAQRMLGSGTTIGSLVLIP